MIFSAYSSNISPNRSKIRARRGTTGPFRVTKDRSDRTSRSSILHKDSFAFLLLDDAEDEDFTVVAKLVVVRAVLDVLGEVVLDAVVEVVLGAVEDVELGVVAAAVLEVVEEMLGVVAAAAVEVVEDIVLGVVTAAVLEVVEGVVFGVVAMAALEVVLVVDDVVAAGVGGAERSTGSKTS